MGMDQVDVSGNGMQPGGVPCHCQRRFGDPKWAKRYAKWFFIFSVWTSE